MDTSAYLKLCAQHFCCTIFNQTCWHFFFFFFSTKTYVGTHNICCQGEIRKIFYQILHNRLIAVNSSCNSKYGTFFQPKLLIVSYFSMKAYIVCYGYSLEMPRNKKNIFPIPFLIWSYAPLQLQFINYHSGLIQLMANWWYFSYFSKKTTTTKQVWHFLQIVSTGDNLHEMSKPVFLEKYFEMLFVEIFTQSAKLRQITFLYLTSLQQPPLWSHNTGSCMEVTVVGI